MLSLHKISLHFGGAPILDAVSVDLRPRERVCVVGRNGSGKSTLLKVMARQIEPDEGSVWQQPGHRLAVLPQEVPANIQGTVAEVVKHGLEGLDWADWEMDRKVERTLEAMALPALANFADLSAGLKRRVWLARCFAAEPHLLLLDEPTNHLDVGTIDWLESVLLDFSGSLLFVTHDRAFLQRVATRILDLDRGQLTSWDCDYDTYRLRKEEWLENEARQNALFDKKLSQEEVWIRQGVKARRTRNMGRVRSLQKMREEHRTRRARTGNVKMEFEEAGRSGVKVVEAINVSFGYGGSPLIKDFSAWIERGDKVGIAGPNGSGKTTLLNLLLGKLSPVTGLINAGTGLQVAYFDQLRDQLDPLATVQDSIADGNQFVEINGRRAHVVSYLQDFLFPPDRARSTVNMLSGGERHRLLLARLFTRPFNLLVMDEPTNDLDLETLELLEELLANYSGTLLLVSHDRAFLDNVVTDLLVLEGGGTVRAFVGGYTDYQAALVRENAAKEKLLPKRVSETPTPKAAKTAPRRMTNRERQELEALPAQIEALEAEIQTLNNQLSDPAFYQSNVEAQKNAHDRLHQLDTSLHTKFSRWEELDQKARGEPPGA